MRIFLDAKILFSAARSDGAVRRLLEDLRQAGHQCVADGYVTGEARRNLEIKCPSALSSLSRILEHVDACRHVAPSASHQQIQLLPEKDRPVLAAAIHLGCQAMVTGDKMHFGALYGLTIGGVTINSPQSLAEGLLGIR